MRIKVLLASLAGTLASLAAHAALVEIVPVSQNQKIGDEVIVDIVGSGFTTPTVQWLRGQAPFSSCPVSFRSWTPSELRSK